jgi:hypothetical protein
MTPRRIRREGLAGAAILPMGSLGPGAADPAPQAVPPRPADLAPAIR